MHDGIFYRLIGEERLKKPSSFHLLHNSTQHRKGQSVRKLEVTEYLLQQSTMHLPTLSFIILFCHTSLAFPQFPYPNQAFKLPKHPSNWICTVHITTPWFSNYTSSDVIERILTTNHEKIIPTVSTTHNRSFSITPVNSFFEPCTISILVDTTRNRSSYIFSDYGLSIYIHANKYVYRGWRHSIIIVVHFSCSFRYDGRSLHLPHRLFYHSLECGPQNIFPNRVFVPNPLTGFVTIEDPTHNIHDRKLPSDIRRLLFRPIYSWSMHDANEKSKHCLNTRWNELPLEPCFVDKFAVVHFQHFLNFTVVQLTVDNLKKFGGVITNGKDVYDPPSIFFHAVDSKSDRIIYCDQNWDTTRLRPINISSPFSCTAWAMLALLMIISAVASSLAIFDLSSITNHLTVVTFIKKISNSLVDLVVVLLEKDLGKRNSIKIFVGLIAIYLGNEYKNQLTIELVFPRAEDAIRNITELLDLNFNIIYRSDSVMINRNKSIFLKSLNLYWEIDADKREKYLREVDRWLMFNVFNDSMAEDILDKITKVIEKNAFLLSAPDHLQVNMLKAFLVPSYPISCHFVKQPFAPQFNNLYFINPKVEEFKWLTAKFLDHGLFEFWKRLHSHLFKLNARRREKFNKRFNNSSSTESPDLSNFIGQVHLSVFYILVSILAVTCILVFLFECAIQNAKELSLFAFKKIQQFGINLLWLFIRCIFLVGRLISRVHQTRKSLQKHTQIIIVQVRSE
jgi:hypothetical protein